MLPRRCHSIWQNASQKILKNSLDDKCLARKLYKQAEPCKMPMKYTKLALISSLTVLSAVSLMAQNSPSPSPWIGQSRVTIALTKSESAPGIDAKDEAGVVITPRTRVYSNYFMNAQGAEINEGIATIAKSRFSNLELLRYILSQERKKEGGSVMKSVAGWSLVYAYDDAEEIDGFYIQRRIRGNKVQVLDVSDYFDSDDSDLSVDVQDDNILKITKNNITTTTATLAEFGSQTLFTDPKAFLTTAQLNMTNWPIGGLKIEMASTELGLTGTISTSGAWDNARKIDSIRSVTINNLIGRYSYNTIDVTQPMNTATTNVIVDGSVTGAASTFINKDIFLEGLDGAMP